MDLHESQTPVYESVEFCSRSMNSVISTLFSPYFFFYSSVINKMERYNTFLNVKVTFYFKYTVMKNDKNLRKQN